MQVIKFSAPWCAPCKALSAELTKYPHVHVMEIDIDENPDVKSRWGLRSVPTLVALDTLTGDEIDRMIGFSSSKQLKGFIENNTEVGTY